METEKQKFQKMMEDEGFRIVDGILMGYFPLIPKHRKDDKGTHTIIKEITFVNFDGSDTAPGDLGCVCIYYHGTRRRKHCRSVENNAEILKKTGCPKTAKRAFKMYQDWKAETTPILNSWKVIL